MRRRKFHKKSYKKSYKQKHKTKKLRKYKVSRGGIRL